MRAGTRRGERNALTGNEPGNDHTSPTTLLPPTRCGSPDCVSGPGRREDSELHPATKSFRSTAHSRSPPLSVTTNDSEIAAPKSSSHIPDWK